MDPRMRVHPFESDDVTLYPKGCVRIELRPKGVMRDSRRRVHEQR